MSIVALELLLSRRGNSTHSIYMLSRAGEVRSFMSRHGRSLELRLPVRELWWRQDRRLWCRWGLGGGSRRARRLFRERPAPRTTFAMSPPDHLPAQEQVRRLIEIIRPAARHSLQQPRPPLPDTRPWPPSGRVPAVPRLPLRRGVAVDLVAWVLLPTPTPGPAPGISALPRSPAPGVTLLEAHAVQASYLRRF
jgi:hypothetical protein